jgi:hypothetical protein
MMSWGRILQMPIRMHISEVSMDGVCESFAKKKYPGKP